MLFYNIFIDKYLLNSLGQLREEVVQWAKGFLRSLLHCSSHSFVIPLLVSFWDIKPFPHLCAFRDRILPDRFDFRIHIYHSRDKK